MRAYILTHVRSGSERDIVRAVKGLPGVIRADFTFGPYDIIVEVEASSLMALGLLVSETIRSQPGVEDTLTCLAVE